MEFLEDESLKAARRRPAWWPREADHRAVWGLAWPMILSNISVPLLGLVDSAILGHLPDARYLAAVAVATTLFGFLYWGFGFLRMGTTGLVAQQHGAATGDAAARRARDGALRLLVAQASLLALAMSLLVLCVTPWLFPLGVELMAPPAEAAAEAGRYWHIRVWSAPAVLLTYVLIGVLVGMQDTRSVLIITVTTNAANIVLDLVLVLGLGLRTEGVAAATLASEWLGLAVALQLARARFAAHPAPLDVAALFDLQRYRALIGVNTHLFVRTLTLIGTLAFFTSQGARQGEAVLAANALLMNLLMLVSYGLDGFAHGAEALAGQRFGARDRTGFLRAVAAAAAFSLGTAGLFTVLFLLSGELFVAGLTDLEAVRVIAVTYLPWLAFLPLVAVWCYLLDGVFIGVTATRAMRDTMLASTFCVFLPLWWLTRSLGNTGLWLALNAFFLARGASLGGCWFSAMRRDAWFPRQSPSRGSDSDGSRVDDPRTGESGAEASAAGSETEGGRG